MEKIKQNLPVILLLIIVPYFFYSDPSLPQAIIAAVIAGIAGFKYHLESKELPDYVKLFEARLIKDREEMDVKYLHAIAKLMEEVEILRKQHNVTSINKNIEKKINFQGW